MLKLKTKERKKINANAVGADATFRSHFKEHTRKTPEANSNPNSKIQTLTSYTKGITLIALIITIIVMLILVAVTINVALNGELFKKAEIARSKTQEEIEKEQLMEVAIAAYDPDTGVNFSNMKTPDGFTKESDGKYTSEKTGKTYTVDKKTAEINEYNGQSSDNVTEIRLGDKWTDVTFKDLPKELPSEEDGMKWIVIANEQKDALWQIMLTGDDGMVFANNALSLIYAPQIDYDGSLSDSMDCIYFYGQSLDPEMRI